MLPPEFAHDAFDDQYRTREDIRWAKKIIKQLERAAPTPVT
jgi:hypothetical protein